MPKPNIFDFNATGSSWDPDVSASIGLTPELSESIRLLNKTIENYVGIDHSGSIAVTGSFGIDSQEHILEFRRHDQGNLGTNQPIFKINLDEVGMDEDWFANAGPSIIEAWHDGDKLWDICGYGAQVPLHPGDDDHGNLIPMFDSSLGKHRRHAPAIMNIWNTSYQSPPTGSHFISLWNVMSGSNGITSESVFLLGTQYNEPFLGIGTTSPSASLHISSSLTGSVTDLLRIQNDLGVPVFKMKPDGRFIMRYSASSANEVTMSVDSDNNFMINDTLGVNHTHMFIKSGSKKITLEVSATSGDLKFKRVSDGKVLMRVKEADTGSIFTEGDIIAAGHVSASRGYFSSNVHTNTISNFSQDEPYIEVANNFDISIGDPQSAGNETYLTVDDTNQNIQTSKKLTVEGSISASGDLFIEGDINGSGDLRLETDEDIILDAGSELIHIYDGATRKGTIDTSGVNEFAIRTWYQSNVDLTLEANGGSGNINLVSDSGQIYFQKASQRYGWIDMDTASTLTLKAYVGYDILLSPSNIVTVQGDISASGDIWKGTDKYILSSQTGSFGGGGGAVDSIVAGDGIDISGATGDVTVTAETAAADNPGVVELATTAETTTGTDTTRAVTPDGLKDGFEGSANIETVGTIGSGEWEGTVIGSTYLDSDTAHLTTNQTFSGLKTFSSAITASGNISASNTVFADTGSFNYLNAPGAILGYSMIRNEAGNGNITDQVITLNQTSFTLIESAQGTKAGVIFIAPPSRNVEIEFNASMYNSMEQVFFGLSTSDSSYTEIEAIHTYDNHGNYYGDETDRFTLTMKWIVEGLTAGTSYTYYVWYKVSAGTAYIYHGESTHHFATWHMPPVITKATALPATFSITGD